MKVSEQNKSSEKYFGTCEEFLGITTEKGSIS
jgi:hypothetical protein